MLEMFFRLPRLVAPERLDGLRCDADGPESCLGLRGLENDPRDRLAGFRIPNPHLLDRLQDDEPTALVVGRTLVPAQSQ
jgi:hypothetical protein